MVKTKTDTSKETDTAKPEIRIENTEKKGSAGFGIAEKLKNLWQSHAVAKKEPEEKLSPEEEKRRAEAIDNPDEFFENFDPKKDSKKLTSDMRKRIIEAEKLYQEGIISAKDLIAPTSVEITNHEMTLNGMYVKSFFVFNYPRYLEANWMSNLINFDATLDISIFVYPTDSLRMMKILRRKVAEMLSSKHMNEKRGLVSDVGLDTALEDAESLRIDLQRGNEKFFQVGVYFTIYADTKEKLDKSARQLETILGGQLVMTRPSDFRIERAFETTLPQCTDMIEVVRNMNTSPLSTTFPFVSSDLTSNEGILYGINRHNNSLIIFDRFNLENANAVVFAKSGAGKSYAVKLEILRSLMFDTDVIVIDPENEYESLARTVGGSYIRLSLTSGQRINPFDLPLPVNDEEARPGELLRENAITLSGLMSVMLGKLTPEEEALMDKAILQTYEIKGITADTVNPAEYEMPIMADLENILRSMEGGASLAVRLEKFTKGSFSGLFSDQTNVDLGTGLVVFCIRDLEEQLRPISMYILINFVWNRIRSDLKRRLLIIDEAWHMIQQEDSGRFLHNITKRARKYYLGVTTITQDVEDFLDSKWGKPIITNSSLQLLLRQAPVAMERLQKVFNLTNNEKYMLLNSGIGQGLFFAGNQHVAIQIIASYGENRIITTNPEELLQMKKEKQ